MDLDDDELKATRKAKGLEKTADETLYVEGYNKIDKSTKEGRKYWEKQGLFEYELKESVEIWIIDKSDDETDCCIFYKDKTVVCFDLNLRNKYEQCYIDLSPSEIRAIYKKCEELGWI